MPSNKRKKKNKKSQKTNNIDFQSMLLVAIGIILGVIIYSNQEGFGHIIKDILIGGLLGRLAFAIPVAFILMGIYVVFKDYSKFKLKALQFIILLFTAAATFTTFDYPYSKEAPPENWFSAIGNLCNMGTTFATEEKAGGGLLGALIAVPLNEGFGSTVSKVVLITVMVIIAFLITRISFSSIIIGIKDMLSHIGEKGKEGVQGIATKIHNKRLEHEAETEDDDEEYDYEEEPEEEEEQLQIKEPPKKSRNKKFDEIMKQTAVVETGKQLEFEDIDLTNYQDEEESDEDEETVEEPDYEEENEQEEQRPVRRKLNLQKNLYSKKQEEPVEDNKPEVLNLEHNVIEEYDDYIFPPVSLLNEGERYSNESSGRELREIRDKLQTTLTNFNVDARVVGVTRGPTVTQYEVQPNVGVKVSKILNLSDDIALNLAAKSIRIEAPIPGKSAVGIEVPNRSKETVWLRDVIESDAFQDATSKVTFALGKTIDGEPYVSDIAKMPHMLIAGATGSGKSVCINSILISLLFKAKPNEVKLILIDPKVVELGVYNDIPHLLIPVVTDPKKAAGALNWAVQEMVDRYNKFASKGVRDIRGYNEALNEEGEDGILPQIVIIVDELADLMMVAPGEVEDAICRLAQMARAAGMHLIIATQRPSVDVVTGIIKANIPSRIAFTVSSQVDSRTILDMGGAEKLLGKGDMLYYPIGESKPIRVQGTYVSDKEIEEIVDFIKRNSKTAYNPDVLEAFEKINQPPQAVQEQQSDADEFLMDAIELAVKMGNASASMIQRKFKVGYARAGRIIDQMEERGIISGYDGSKPRQVLISEEEWDEMKEAGIDSVYYEDYDESQDESQESDTDDEEYEEDDTEYVESDDTEYEESDDDSDEESEEESDEESDDTDSEEEEE